MVVTLLKLIDYIDNINQFHFKSAITLEELFWSENLEEEVLFKVQPRPVVKKGSDHQGLSTELTTDQASKALVG